MFQCFYLFTSLISFASVEAKVNNSLQDISCLVTPDVVGVGQFNDNNS